MPYIVDGQPVAIADEPKNQDGTLWVPLRALSEAVGATVDWDQDLQQVIVQHPRGGNIQLNIGTEDIIKNNEAQGLQAAPYVEGGDTWVPVRFFNIQLGYALNVNLAENLVELTTWNG
ncbi:MAG TPA: copper amine oxidase N-terminal domain-containing protein [Abditibacteriaceae bacterium]|jgi:hypothetical protein